MVGKGDPTKNDQSDSSTKSVDSPHLQHGKKKKKKPNKCIEFNSNFVLGKIVRVLCHTAVRSYKARNCTKQSILHVCILLDDYGILNLNLTIDKF